MLDEYFQRKDVSEFIKAIRRNEKYFQKSRHSFSEYSLFVSSEIALYIFYDALWKYKILVDDDILLGDYLFQLEKLFRKLEDFENLRFGIHKLLAKNVARKNDITDWEESRNELTAIIYEKYIVNGYFIHGFHPSYSENIIKEGFTPEVYENYYPEFEEVNGIFEKYKVPHMIHKDFHGNSVCFTDDCVLGCYYSMYAPLYYFQFMTSDLFLGRKGQKEDYLMDDYSHFVLPLRKYMSNRFFSDADKKKVMSVVDQEWKLIHRGKKRLSLLLVPRKCIPHNDIPLEEYLKADMDVFEGIDQILSSKYNNVLVNTTIPKENLQVMILPHYYHEEEKIVSDETFDLSPLLRDERIFASKEGHVSLFLLLGSLLISLGVLLTIFSIFRG